MSPWRPSNSGERKFRKNLGGNSSIIYKPTARFRKKQENTAQVRTPYRKNLGHRGTSANSSCCGKPKDVIDKTRIGELETFALRIYRQICGSKRHALNAEAVWLGFCALNRALLQLSRGAGNMVFLQRHRGGVRLKPADATGGGGLRCLA